MKGPETFAYLQIGEVVDDVFGGGLVWRTHLLSIFENISKATQYTASVAM